MSDDYYDHDVEPPSTGYESSFRDPDIGPKYVNPLSWLTDADLAEMDALVEKCGPHMTSTADPMIDGKPFSIGAWVNARAKERLATMSPDERKAKISDSTCNKNFFIDSPDET